jgi:hypothetical protein
MTDQDSWQTWFEEIWAYREEKLYRQWFGNIGHGIVCLSPKLFQHLGVSDPDPRWLHHGIFECPPTGPRKHWAYITSGLSNPWGADPKTVDPKAFTGLGLEFLLLTPTRATWALDSLKWLSSVTLLLAAGRIRGSLPELHDRVPLGIDPSLKTDLRHLLLTEPSDLPSRFQLDSGVADLMLCVGITEAERAFAQEHGSGELLVKLRIGGAYPITDPARKSLV